MKIALYIEDGKEQIVLTPETETEKGVISGLTGGRVVSIYRGGFYDCKGGWTRHSLDKESTIIVLRPVEKESS